MKLAFDAEQSFDLLTHFVGKENLSEETIVEECSAFLEEHAHPQKKRKRNRLDTTDNFASKKHLSFLSNSPNNDIPPPEPMVLDNPAEENILFDNTEDFLDEMLRLLEGDNQLYSQASPNLHSENTVIADQQTSAMASEECRDAFLDGSQNDFDYLEQDDVWLARLCDLPKINQNKSFESIIKTVIREIKANPEHWLAMLKNISSPSQTDDYLEMENADKDLDSKEIRACLLATLIRELLLQMRRENGKNTLEARAAFWEKASINGEYAFLNSLLLEKNASEMIALFRFERVIFIAKLIAAKFTDPNGRYYKTLFLRIGSLLEGAEKLVKYIVGGHQNIETEYRLYIIDLITTGKLYPRKNSRTSLITAGEIDTNQPLLSKTAPSSTKEADLDEDNWDIDWDIFELDEKENSTETIQNPTGWKHRFFSPSHSIGANKDTNTPKSSNLVVSQKFS